MDQQNSARVCRCAGCITDVSCLKYLLQKRFRFQDADIRVLTDDNPDPNWRPTLQNICYWIGSAHYKLERQF